MTTAISESEAWLDVSARMREAAQLLKDLGEVRHLEGSPIVDALTKSCDHLLKLSRDMRQQVAAGVHKNPALVVLGNPGGRRIISRDTMAILYKHKQDGEFYCHGFGDADIRLQGTARSLHIHGMHEKTGVQMVANDDGSITISHPKHPVWGRF